MACIITHIGRLIQRVEEVLPSAAILVIAVLTIINVALRWLLGLSGR
jgi:hypothetical protein